MAPEAPDNNINLETSDEEETSSDEEEETSSDEEEETDEEMIIRMDRLIRLCQHMEDINKDIANIRLLEDEWDLFTQEDWDDLVIDYVDLPKSVVNKFIIRKNDLGKKKGMNIFLYLDCQNIREYDEDFFIQDFMIELLNMPKSEYVKIMGYHSCEQCGMTRPWDDDALWSILFDMRQQFSKQFLMENADHFYLELYHAWETIHAPIEIFEKYFHKEGMYITNVGPLRTRAAFVRQHMRQHCDKIDLLGLHATGITELLDYTEEIFTEFLSYPELSGEKFQAQLWVTVGMYNISEQFIRDNLRHINKPYDKYIHGYIEWTNPWILIINNNINYSEAFLEEFMEHIPKKALWPGYRTFTGSGQEPFSEEFIRKHFIGPDYSATAILDQKAIVNMDGYVEELLRNGDISTYELSQSNWVSLTLIEKYHSKLNGDEWVDNVFWYNNNMTFRFFADKILKWYPDIELDIWNFICIDTCSEEVVNFFIEEYHKKYTEEDIVMCYRIIHDVMKYGITYSEKLTTFIKKKYTDNKLASKLCVFKYTKYKLWGNETWYKKRLAELIDDMSLKQLAAAAGWAPL